MLQEIKNKTLLFSIDIEPFNSNHNQIKIDDNLILILKLWNIIVLDLDFVNTFIIKLNDPLMSINNQIFLRIKILFPSKSL